MSNVIEGALANSACRSSGHNLGSQRAFLSRALLAATTGRTTIRRGAMAYELDSFDVEGVDVAAVLAWAEATASPDRTYTLRLLWVVKWL
jgi:hypothetical protein